MNTIRPDLPPMPARIAALPVAERGYPIPYFVAMVEGKPNFQIADSAKLKACVKLGLCWVCGQRMGRFKCFAVGPMCTVNRVSAEPPSHLDCCEWSVKACPFLLMPKMVRRDIKVPQDKLSLPAGVMIDRNPGVTALWVTESYQLIRAPNGNLFQIGTPVQVTWWREGRPATGEEVEESVAGGLPILASLCNNDEDRAELERMRLAAQAFYPAPQSI